MHGLCECGCGRPTRVPTQTHRSQGEVKGVPMRFVSGHNRRGQRVRTERWREEDRGHATACWIWLGHIAPNGYGKATNPRKRGMVGAHRLVFEEQRGQIPAGHDLDHLCRTRECVNPDHLEPVTRGENLRRGYEARRSECSVSHA